MFKKLFCLAFAFCIMISQPSNIFANNSNLSELERYAEEYQITVDELLNFEENFNRALEELEIIQSQRVLNNNDDIVIQVSENLFLNVNTYIEYIDYDINHSNYNNFDSRATTILASHTFNLTNIWGGTIATLRSHGMFRYDGSNAEALDAYGTYSGFIWTWNEPSSTTGNSGTSAFARNSFSGELSIGVDPISVTIQSFATTNTLTCDRNGNVSSLWR